MRLRAGDSGRFIRFGTRSRSLATRGFVCAVAVLLLWWVRIDGYQPQLDRVDVVHAISQAADGMRFDWHLPFASAQTIGVNAGLDASTLFANDVFPDRFPFVIPGGAPVTTSGPASPYGRVITVPAASGPVFAVQVRLLGFGHTWPEDVDVLLQGPGGQTVILMSDVGGGTDVASLTLTINDSFNNPAMPNDSLLTGGSYRPTNNPGFSDVFPAPAPAGPYGSNLGVFEGVDPVGAWRLWVVDNANLDVGELATGWELTLATVPGQTDMAIDFGGAGLWTYYNAGEAFTTGDGLEAGANHQWVQLHPLSPSLLAHGYAGGAREALFANFPGFGVWRFDVGVGWSQVHPFDASALATADLDGDFADDLIVDFPGLGLFVRYNSTGLWRQLHTFNTAALATGNIDGDFRDDVIAYFPGYGIFTFRNNTAWSQLHTWAPEDLETGDLDGNGMADVLVDFGPAGLWAYVNDTTWEMVHPVSPDGMLTGNIDGDPLGRRDLIVNFPGQGVWARINNASWVQIHPLSTSVMGMADIDGNGKKDLMVSLPGAGVWVYKNNHTWESVNPSTAEALVSGAFDDF